MARNTGKRPPDATRSTLPLGVEDYDLLKEVSAKNGWTLTEATWRAVHALFALDAHIDSMADGDGGEHGRLLRRVWREVDPGC